VVPGTITYRVKSKNKQWYYLNTEGCEIWVYLKRWENLVL
jgi:hypothetical protein